MRLAHRSSASVAQGLPNCIEKQKGGRVGTAQRTCTSADQEPKSLEVHRIDCIRLTPGAIISMMTIRTTY